MKNLHSSTDEDLMEPINFSLSSRRETSPVAMDSRVTWNQGSSSMSVSSPIHSTSLNLNTSYSDRSRQFSTSSESSKTTFVADDELSYCDSKYSPVKISIVKKTPSLVPIVRTPIDVSLSKQSQAAASERTLSESSTATLETDDERSYCNSKYPSVTISRVKKTPSLTPFVRTPKDEFLSKSPAISEKMECSPVEQERSRHSSCSRSNRSPTSVENNFSLYSDPSINQSSLNNSRSPPFESFPLTSSPHNSFQRNPFQNFSESASSSCEQEYNDVNTDNNNNSLFRGEESTSINPLLMPGLSSILNLPAFRHQLANPLFLSAFYNNLINQQVANNQPTASPLSPNSVKPSFPQGQHMPSMATHQPIPSGMSPLLPIGQIPYTVDLEDEARRQEAFLKYRAEATTKRQKEQNRRRYNPRTSQHPKEKSFDVSSSAGQEESSEGELDKKRAKADPSIDTVKDEAYWERRNKNNLAAKKSRDAKKAKEDAIRFRAAYLQQENIQLQIKNKILERENRQLKSEFKIYKDRFNGHFPQ